MQLCKRDDGAATDHVLIILVPCYTPVPNDLSQTMSYLVVYCLTLQVAIQCVAPATILLGCAMILLQRSSGGDGKQAEMLQIPIGFWKCIADFCGWWTCACWFLYSAGSLTLIKSRLLQA